jgi:hypothetical protein
MTEIHKPSEYLTGFAGNRLNWRAGNSVGQLTILQSVAADRFLDKFGFIPGSCAMGVNHLDVA